MEPIKAVSPTVSGTDKSGGSYRKWKLFRAADKNAALYFYEYEVIVMEQNRLDLYQIDMKYIRELSETDDKVMSVLPQADKENRPFVGIMIICAGKKYYIPFGSPKPKHLFMKNNVDFTKIYDGDKLSGVLNFNNMIPVDENVIKVFDFRPDENDTVDVRQYKKLCAKQLDWCKKHTDHIVKKANKLYYLVTEGKGTYPELIKRCCNFKKLEAVLEKHINISASESKIQAVYEN